MGKSTHSVLLLQSLRITNTDGVLSLKIRAFVPRTMEVRLGRSIHKQLPKSLAVKHYMRRILECTIIELHGRQFRQICGSVPFWRIHHQTQHESNSRNNENQREVTATWIILFITSFLTAITLKRYTRTVAESVARKSNGGQFRQFCSSLSL